MTPFLDFGMGSVDAVEIVTVFGQRERSEVQAAGLEDVTYHPLDQMPENELNAL